MIYSTNIAVKGRVAVLVREGNTVTCYAAVVNISGARANAVMADIDCICGGRDVPMFSTEFNVYLDWLNDSLSAYCGASTFFANLREFAQQVIAVNGNGNFVFEVNGLLNSPTKMNTKRFYRLISDYGIDGSSLFGGGIAFSSRKISPQKATVQSSSFSKNPSARATTSQAENSKTNWMIPPNGDAAIASVGNH